MPYAPIITHRLGSQLTSVREHPHQLLREFNKFAELLKRDDIKRLLFTEREILLRHFITTAAAIKVQIHQRFSKVNFVKENLGM